MLDKETYLNELTRYFDSVRDDEYKDEAEPTSCVGVSCTDCIFNKGRSRYCIYTLEHIFDALEVLEKWSNEHPKPKYKVSQVEYDILKSFKKSNLYSKFYFNSSLVTRNLLKLGYFEGADENMKIKYYRENCEVVHD